MKNNKIQSDYNALPTVSLPWIPALSPKLRKIFRKVEYRIVFKSNPNLRSLLTRENKSKLPHISQPGTYLIECNYSKRYVGERKLQIRTRTHQHLKSVNESKHNQSAIDTNSKFCTEEMSLGEG